MDNFPRAFETKCYHVVAGIGLVKHQTQEGRIGEPLCFNAIRFDGFKFDHCVGSLLGNPLAKSWPIGTFYFMYHALDLVEGLQAGDLEVRGV